jgi:hypothetical protein
LVDVAIILAALFSLIAFILLGVAAWEIIGLVQEVRGEVKTLIGTAKETMAEVQGTARFVNDSVVGPVSKAAAFAAASSATLKAFSAPLFKRKG